MKPAPFEYFRPRSMDEALDLLAAHGPDAKPLAGGQSLIPAMNFRLATPAVLVDLNEIAGLSNVTSGDGFLRVGAMARHRSLERSEMVAGEAPLVAAAMPFIAHAAIRTRGTLGGSLAHADPAAELPAVMLALDAVFTLRSGRSSRTVCATDFFTGLFSTVLEPGELLTEVAIPRRPPRSAHAFEEMARRHGDLRTGRGGRVGGDRRARPLHDGADCAVQRRRSAGAGRARPPSAGRRAADPRHDSRRRRRRRGARHRSDRATFMPRARTGGISPP